jgi:hypothetical protein
MHGLGTILVGHPRQKFMQAIPKIDLLITQPSDTLDLPVIKLLGIGNRSARYDSRHSRHAHRPTRRSALPTLHLVVV